jgi:biopolymer transport protein ExbD
MATASVTDLWRVRREQSGGEGRTVSLARLIQGVADGLWVEGDEVRGPQDPRWLAIADHPLIEEYLPPRPPFKTTPEEEEEETEIDLTPMIDVTFQLIIFFMITATFVLQKTLDAPTAGGDQQDAPARRPTLIELRENNIIVTVKADGAITVDDKPVTLAEYSSALEEAARRRDNLELVLDLDDGIEHETVVRLIDGAAGAEIEKVHFARRAPPPD